MPPVQALQPTPHHHRGPCPAYPPALPALPAQLPGEQILAAEVARLQERVEAAVEDKDAALAQGLGRLEGDLEAVQDERDDLAQRLRFLERQMQRWVYNIYVGVYTYMWVYIRFLERQMQWGCVCVCVCVSVRLGA